MSSGLLIYNFRLSGYLIYQFTIIFTIYCIIRILFLLIVRNRRFKLFQNYGIPGPKPRLLDGSWFEYQRWNDKLVSDNKMRLKYGRLFGIYFGDEPNIMTTDLKVIRGAFIDSKDSFKERSETAIDIPLTRGLLFARYPRWKAMRKMLTPGFNKFHRRGGSSSQFVEETLKMMLDYVDSKYKSCSISNEPCVLDIRALMKATSLRLISTMAIRLEGINVSEKEPSVQALDRFIEEGNKGFVVLAVLLPHLKKFFSFMMKRFELSSMLGTIHKRLDQLIDTHLNRISLKSTSNNDNISHQDQPIDIMIKMHHENKLTRDELLGTSEIILLAGYDTTSTTLAYIFWVIAKYPAVQNRLRTDLMTHGIDCKYLGQVINETMRLYPVAPYIATRLATKNVTLNGWLIPRGTRIMYNSWLVHRDPEIWSNPLEFNPDRFKEGTKIDPCAFAPFGLGERQCLAYKLAQLEMKMIICDFILKYRLILIGPENLELMSVGFVTTQPKEEVLIQVEQLD